MHHFLAKLFCILAAVTILEVPTVLLQSYAWATMLSDRIPEQGLSEAVSSTFDGKHPCDHCLAAQELQLDKRESNDTAPLQQLQLGNVKLIELCTLGIILPSAPPASLLPHTDDEVGYTLSIYPSVPTPPPRLS